MSHAAQEFWVIFDTATVPEYYQDVHNVLALPQGGIIRYEYRSKYLSKGSLERLQRPSNLPRSCLIVFTQPMGANRGDNLDAESISSGKLILWVATRLALLPVNPIRSGEFFIFDLKMMQYPQHDINHLMTIINPLIQSGETPYRGKWVTISDQVAALVSIRVGDETENWQEIVRQIGQPKALFEGDFFWRLRGPFIHRFRSLALRMPRYRTSFEIGAEHRLARGLRFSYSAAEGASMLIDASSYRPSGLLRRARPLVKVSVEKDGPIMLHGGPPVISVNLRHYTTQTVGLHAKRYDELDRREGIIRFESGDWVNGFPVGPEIELPISVRKNVFRLVTGVAAALEAVALTFFATKLPAEEFGTALIYIILAFVMATAAVFMLTGRLTIPRIS